MDFYREDLLSIDVEPLCSYSSDESFERRSNDDVQLDFIQLMRNIYQKCSKKQLQKRKSSIDVSPKNEFVQSQRKKSDRILTILPYENTFSAIFYPNGSNSIDSSMIDKIIIGVRSMGAALTSRRDIEDALNDSTLLVDRFSSNFTAENNVRFADEFSQKRLSMEQNHLKSFTDEHIHVRMSIDLILADNRLCGRLTLCQSDSIILSCLIRKLFLCAQQRTLCASNDVHSPSIERSSLSSDEFFEILGELYQNSSKILDEIRYFYETENVADSIRYVLRDDAVRLLIRLIVERQYENQFETISKFEFPSKFNDLFKFIDKLRQFMPNEQVLSTIRKTFLSQLAERSKTKKITVNDLRALNTQISLSDEDLMKTVDPNLVKQFYLDFHDKEDIDDRLAKIRKKIDKFATTNSCISRVQLKMLIEQTDGTRLEPFLEQFRHLSIIDLLDDLLESNFISLSELIVSSRQEIVVRKSSLIKHFDEISFLRKHDVDRLAQTTLVIRHDELIVLLEQRAEMMRQFYIKTILNGERSIKCSTSLEIHGFLRKFDLKASCAKIFLWMGMTDAKSIEKIVKTNEFVNEYALDEIDRCFLDRLDEILAQRKIFFSIDEEKFVDDRIVYRLKSDDLDHRRCFLTVDQSSLLVDFADPEYQNELNELIEIHDVISEEKIRQLFDSNRNEILLDEFSSLIFRQCEVIEISRLVNSFRQRIAFRQNRFERIQRLQSFLLSPKLFNISMRILNSFPPDYFSHLDLQILKKIQLIDAKIFGQFVDSIVDSTNYFPTVDPTIEKYSKFLTEILRKILFESTRIDEDLETFLMTFDEMDFEWILHFRRRSMINENLRNLLHTFKRSSMEKAQRLIENESTIIEFLLRKRRNSQPLTIDDVRTFLQSYPIPCRIDLLDHLRRRKLISRAFTDELTIEQCCQLNSANVETQSTFLFYMLIKLIRTKNQFEEFLTAEEILQSARSFFLEQFFSDETLKNLREEKFVRIDRLAEYLKQTKILKEKLQRKVDVVLTKTDDLSTKDSSTPLNLRSLRHHFLQAKIRRNQLDILVQQGGWSNEIAAQFRRELDIVESDNSLDLIRHITEQISLLLRENGSISEDLLDEHFRQHPTLFFADFEILLRRDGFVPIEDLLDLFLVCRLAKANDMQSYVKTISSLNVNKFNELRTSPNETLVKKIHIENHLENRPLISMNDLSLLLNQLLKLDRLKRIIDLMPNIRTYLRLHPINNLNALKAFQFEFDLNHHDLKFLRDLKLFDELWYKQYLLSRTSDTTASIVDVFDEDFDTDDRQELQPRPSVDDEIEFESLDEIFAKKKSLIDAHEQRRKIFLEQMRQQRKQSIEHVHDDENVPFDFDVEEFSATPNRSKGTRDVLSEATTIESSSLIPTSTRLESPIEKLQVEILRLPTTTPMIDDRTIARWLKRTIEHNEDLSRQTASMIEHRSLIELNDQVKHYVSTIEQFNDYLQTEFEEFRQQLNNDEDRKSFQTQIDSIEFILYDGKLHCQALIELVQRMISIDRLVKKLNESEFEQEWNRSKNDVRRLIEEEHWQIQPRLATRIEGAIRTLIDSIDRSVLMKMADRTTSSSVDFVPQTDIAKIQRRLSTIALELEALKRRKEEKEQMDDLIRRETAERLENIQKTYAEEKRLDLSTISPEKVEEILSDIIEIRNYANYPVFPPNAQLKYIHVDSSNEIVEQSQSLVNTKNQPISDRLRCVRLPKFSDRFEISSNQRELRIIDDEGKAISELISFENLTDRPLKFEYVDENRTEVKLIDETNEYSINEIVQLKTQPTPIDENTTRSKLFVVDQNDFQLSKAIELNRSADLSELELRTFLVDQRTDEKRLLTPAQYEMMKQQIEFTTRKFATFVTLADGTIVSQPIEPSELSVRIRNAFEEKLLEKLKTSDNELLKSFVVHRLETMKTEEKTIEVILPILDPQHDLVSADQIEYKREQKRLDELHQLSKSVVESTADELIQIADELQLEKLPTEIDELRSIVGTEIEQRSKLVQNKCEQLSIKIQEKENQFENVANVRLEFVQFLKDQFDRDSSIEKREKEIFETMKMFDTSPLTQYVENQLQLEHHQRSLNEIERLETLLNTTDSIPEEKLKEIATFYQIDFPQSATVEEMRNLFDEIRKTSKEQFEIAQTKREDFIRQLNDESKEQRDRKALIPEDQLSLINAYVQQAAIETIEIREEFEVMKIEKLSKDLFHEFETNSIESRIPLMNSLNYTIENLKSYRQILSEKSNEERMSKFEKPIADILKNFQNFYVADAERDQANSLLNKYKGQAVEQIVESHAFELLSRRCSPDLLALHQVTSGQIFFPSIKRQNLRRFQLAGVTSVEDEWTKEPVAIRSNEDKQNEGKHQPDTFSLPNEQSTRIVSLPEEHHEILLPTASSQIEIELTREMFDEQLKLVGNAKKYSIIESKPKQQQLATINDRSTKISQRTFGEVYVRHRDNNVEYSTSQDDLNEKIQAKRRFVKLNRTTRGNTVIHRQVGFSARQCVVPGEVKREETVRSMSPLNQINTIELPPLLKTKSSSKSIVEIHSDSSPTVLSPVIEATEEIDRRSDVSNATIFSRNIEESSPIEPVKSSPPIVPPASPVVKPLKVQKIKESKKIKIEPQEEIIQLEEINPSEKIDDNLVTEGFELEQTESTVLPSISATIPEGTVIFHRVGLQKKKKTKKKRTKEEPTDFPRRKAIPFISAIENEQIEVEDDVRISSKKKRKKRSDKSKTHRSRSRSRSKKKKVSAVEQRDIPLRPMTNRQAIERHLLTVQRFTGPPVSPIAFDRSRSKYNDDVIEIPLDQLEHRRIHLIKPMWKNFDSTNVHHETLQYSTANDFDKELFDFDQDTKQIDQPAIFNEFIPEFFQKQAEEKQSRRISLTAIQPDDNLMKRLAPRIPRLYKGWQPSETSSTAHTDVYRPLNRRLITDVAFYFDDDFVDVSGLFQNAKPIDRNPPRIKPTNQRYRDEFIVKEFFNCWKQFTSDQARLIESRRQRILIDFRDLWFQDALSNPFYSYFEEPTDYVKKHDTQHQLAYRLQKRLVRTGREQPKDTMSNKTRQGFLPLLFNLPKSKLNRQISLHQRYDQLMSNNENENEKIPLKHLFVTRDDLLILIRQRLKLLNRTATTIDEEDLVEKFFEKNFIEEKTLKDFDDYLTFFPPIKQKNEF